MWWGGASKGSSVGSAPHAHCWYLHTWHVTEAPQALSPPLITVSSLRAWQVAEKVRQDPRVTVMERTNLRNLRLPDIGGEPVDLVTLDLSFISGTGGAWGGVEDGVAGGVGDLVTLDLSFISGGLETWGWGEGWGRGGGEEGMGVGGKMKVLPAGQGRIALSLALHALQVLLEEACGMLSPA